MQLERTLRARAPFADPERRDDGTALKELTWYCPDDCDCLTLTHCGDACHNDLQQGGNSVLARVGKANNIPIYPPKAAISHFVMRSISADSEARYSVIRLQSQPG